MRGQHLGEVHAVQLVARENQHGLDTVLLDVHEVLADGIGGALIPVGSFEGLLDGNNFDESAVETIKLVRLPNVPMQADRVELRQQVNAVDAAIQSIGDRNIDQAVFPGQRNRGFRTVLGQRKQPCPFPSAENQSDRVVHNTSQSAGRVIRRSSWLSQAVMCGLATGQFRGKRSSYHCCNSDYSDNLSKTSPTHPAIPLPIEEGAASL